MIEDADRQKAYTLLEGRVIGEGASEITGADA
jgi:hypothetical protein